MQIRNNISKVKNSKIYSFQKEAKIGAQSMQGFEHFCFGAPKSTEFLPFFENYKF